MYAPPKVLVQKLSTGDVIVFDKGTRDLYLIDSKGAKKFDLKGENPSAEAKELVSQGRAAYYNRAALVRLQAALAGIVLLSPDAG